MAEDRPKIIVIPPLALLLAGLVALMLERRLPLGLLPPFPWMPGLALGLPLTLAAVIVNVSGARAFLRAKTPINPLKTPQTVVRRGPFRFTRNPMYLGMVGLLAGLGITFSSLWFLLAALVLWAVLHHGAVLPEERYMLEKFGSPYEEFLRTTRRWL